MAHLKRTSIIAVGGFPGSGKSTVAGMLASEFRRPLLSSDLVGNSIKQVLLDHGAPAEAVQLAFRAGYVTLFALADRFVADECPVIIDMSLGWQFQWDALDAIPAKLETVEVRPVILDCSPATCAARLGNRHDNDPSRHPPAPEFLDQPHLEGVAAFLTSLNRPDAMIIDAEPPIREVYDAVRTTLRASGESR